MKIVCYFLLFLFSLYTEEIYVTVPTSTSSLHPFFLHSFETTRPSFPPSYLHQLLDILEKDFCLSGFMIPTSLDRVQKIQVHPFLYATQFYVEVKIPSTSQPIRSFPFHLTGNEEKDREKIHALVRELQQELFGIEGIQGKKILYCLRTSKKAEKTSEIWLTSLGDKQAKQLSFERNYCVCPKFLPRHPCQHFFYVSYKGGQSKIMASSLFQPRSWPVLPLRGNQHLPTISPQLDKMAFISDITGSPDLFLQYFDTRGRPRGRPRQLFSLPRSTQASSTFSPEGKRLAFVSDKDGPPRIYILNIPSESDTHLPTATLITKKNTHNSSPSWSKDGKKLAYSAKTRGIRQIWVYDFETCEEKQISDSLVNLENPCWASNNFHIICNSEEENGCELYLLHLNDKKPIQITEGPGEKRFPCWEP